MERFFAILLLSLICKPQDAQSQTGVKNAVVAKGVSVEEAIVMQWCGEDEVPSLPFKNTARIFDSQKNVTVKLTPGKVACPMRVDPSLFTMDLNRDPVHNATYPNYASDFSSTGYFRAGVYYYPREGFCITEWTEWNVTVRACGKYSNSKVGKTGAAEWSYPECGSNGPCLPKCCAMNKMFTLTATDKGPKQKCLDPFGNSTKLNPILYSKVWEKSREKPVHYFRNRMKHCGGRIAFAVHESNPLHQYYYATLRQCFRIQEDGSLFVLSKFKWVKVPLGGYCMDGFQMDGSRQNLPVEPFLGEEKHYGILLCHNSMEEYGFQNYYYYCLQKESDGHSHASYAISYGIAFVIASIFLLLTFVVYVLLWKEQKIQGWTTMSHSATMFLMYCFLAGNQFRELTTKAVGRTGTPLTCKVSAIFLHFFFLSNFCWLTVICFSLFCTFRSISAGNTHARNISQYIGYAAFGWGFPFLFVMVSVVMEEVYGDLPCNEVVIPAYGQISCTISAGSMGRYLYYPVGFLLMLNMIFFSITAYKLYIYRKSTSMARENLNKNAEIKEMFQLFAKLFFVMGFTWIFEFVSWYFAGAEKKWYWAVADIFNILQGIAIFIIYICKANTLTSLEKNYPQCRRLLNVSQRFRQRSADVRDLETSGTHVMSTSLSQSGYDGKKNVPPKNVNQNPM